LEGRRLVIDHHSRSFACRYASLRPGRRKGASFIPINRRLVKKNRGYPFTYFTSCIVIQPQFSVCGLLARQISLINERPNHPESKKQRKYSQSREAQPRYSTPVPSVSGDPASNENQVSDEHARRAQIQVEPIRALELDRYKRIEQNGDKREQDRPSLRARRLAEPDDC
jgi:hypothetical protein